MRRGTSKSFHVMPYFSIQINSKLDVGMQSVIRVIIYDTKCTFKKFMVQSIKIKFRVLRYNFPKKKTTTFFIAFYIFHEVVSKLS